MSPKSRHVLVLDVHRLFDGVGNLVETDDVERVIFGVTYSVDLLLFFSGGDLLLLLLALLLLMTRWTATAGVEDATDVDAFARPSCGLDSLAFFAMVTVEYYSINKWLVAIVKRWKNRQRRLYWVRPPNPEHI